MRLYLNQTVLDAALDRLRFLFDEFAHVIVNFSGGKDSTVVLQLALQVAHEKGRLPLKVHFLDQEAEWQTVIDYIRTVMNREDVEPYWFQVPIKMFNATSFHDHWLYAWGEDDRERWLREKEPDSIHENVFNETRFHQMFTKINNHYYPDEPVASLIGSRAEESPARFWGLTSHPTYKWVTWGKVEDKKRQHFTFSPLYDWETKDVWYAIHEHGWDYCKLYDLMYQHGVPFNRMRVSNLHHETAIHQLFDLQEIEPETYNKLTARLAGVDMAGKMGLKNYFPKKLPFMFASWKEYRDHLMEKVVDEAHKPKLQKLMDGQEKKYLHWIGDRLYKVHVSSILSNDWEGVKLENFEAAPDQRTYRNRNRAAASDQ